MDNEKDKRTEDEKLFISPTEKLAEVYINYARILTNKEIDLLCTYPDILREKLKELPINLCCCGTSNMTAIVLELLERNQRGSKIIDSLTRCRRCGYYPFIIENGSSSECPKCGVKHLRP